ncbi:MAG: hypothetical protein QM756_15575 [Polyangiaceae bacterium]
MRALLLVVGLLWGCGPTCGLTCPQGSGGSAGSGGVGGGGGGAGGAGGASGSGGVAGAGKSPDGSSCGPAPADAPGAAIAYQRFLDWYAVNAPTCGAGDVWPSYACFIRSVDPRQVAAFSECMMSDGCSSISNEDACIANPQAPAAGYQLSGAALAWYQNVCAPKSVTCGFSQDTCNVFYPTLRPEARCAVVACVEGACSDFAACMKSVNARFASCQ